MASKVLPQPALPHTSVVRPFGNPPPVTSSSPSIPVGAFGSGVRDIFNLARGIARLLKLSPSVLLSTHLNKTRAGVEGCPEAALHANQLSVRWRRYGTASSRNPHLHAPPATTAIGSAPAREVIRPRCGSRRSW